MSPRILVACVLAVVLAGAGRIHVTIWIFGHAVARPPVAGLLLAALGLACAAALVLAWRSCRGFRSSPYPRTRLLGATP